MSFYVGTNQASIALKNISSRNLNSLNTNMEKLASGYKVNRASDDAAGLQISNRLTSQINGFHVSIKNANDGISISQVAEGALQETTNLLQRMRNLALQASNATNTTADRVSLNSEYSELKKEINRIASTTNFGNISLLDGSFGVKQLQVGAKANETIPIIFQRSFDVENIGLVEDIKADYVFEFDYTSYSDASGTVTNQHSGYLSAGALDSDPELPEIYLNASNYASARSFAEGINDSLIGINTTEAGVLATAESNGYLRFGTDPDSLFGTYNVGVSFDLQAGSNSVNINVASITEFDNTAQVQTIVDEINTQANSIGIQATLVGTDIYLETISGAGADALGMNIEISNFNLSNLPTLTPYDPPDIADDPLTLLIDESVITPVLLPSNERFTISISGVSGNDVLAQYDFDDSGNGTKTTDNSGLLGGEIYIQNINGDDLAKNTSHEVEIDIIRETFLHETNLLKETIYDNNNEKVITDNAQNAIEIIDGAIRQVDQQRALLGATQNRLTSSIMNLSNVTENTSVARSRIKDTDFAIETAKLTQSQVTQSSSTSLLSQANQQPKLILVLLG